MEDCGCWTDAKGYWALSDKCRAEELKIWRRTMTLSRDPEWIDKVRNSPVYPTSHDLAVQYFRQELRKDKHDLE